ncbi:MAG: DNA-processing protein DprA [Planctomycetia bacterium]|nr:DNA-processing protein DprA [Planctomycetia bacterium]
MDDSFRDSGTSGSSDGSRAPGPPDFVRNAYLRLAMVPDIGSVTLNRLLTYFGNDPLRVLAASESELIRVEGVGPRRAGAIRMAGNVPLEETLELCERHGITILTPTDPMYPESLRQIPDPPAVLFLRGELRPEDSLAIAMVGTRHPSLYGRQMATRLAEGFAQAGLTVVSGLARGIDGCSHEGALNGGGRTIAVLGSGILEIYPQEHRSLAERVVERGALLSEMPPKAPPLPEAFPRRNRIVSGLSLGVIVVEAGDRSGTMITVRHASEQGREIFAVPGRLTDRTAHGTLRLLHDGATLVLGVDSVLEQLGPLIDPVTTLRPIAVAKSETSRGTGSESVGSSGSVRKQRSFWPDESGGVGVPECNGSERRGCGETVRDVEKTGVTELTEATEVGETGNTAMTGKPMTIRRPAELLLNDVEQRVLQTIGDGDAVQIDTVIRLSQLTAQQVLTAIAVLEMRKLIRRRGTLVARL